MKLSIMQPYFLPYIGYFSMIKNTNKFIAFDTVQFIKHGWIERNRILKQYGGWGYVAVPLLKHPFTSPIMDVKIDNTQDWRNKILSQVFHYKKIAPFYYKTVKVLEDALDIETDSITELDVHVLDVICRYLEIPFNCEIFSKMNLQIDDVNAPDEWALNICKSMENVDEYWNAIGGKEFFSKEKYQQENISLKFIKHNLPHYSQQGNGFIEGLSILDVLMFNDVKATNQMIQEFSLE